MVINVVVNKQGRCGGDGGGVHIGMFGDEKSQVMVQLWC